MIMITIYDHVMRTTVVYITFDVYDICVYVICIEYDICAYISPQIF